MQKLAPLALALALASCARPFTRPDVADIADAAEASLAAAYRREQRSCLKLEASEVEGCVEAVRRAYRQTWANAVDEEIDAEIAKK